MKTPPPRISVIMPSFNQGPYLEAAITSVLSQSYPDKELIVMDGGSTDQSPDILRKYKSELAYSVSEPDRGQAHALNKSLDHVTGDIIGWLNSDDLYLPGAMERVATVFEQNPDAILVHGDRIMIDSNGHVSGWTCMPAFDPATTGYTICSETVFWRKSAMDNLRFDENLRFAMDVDLFGRLYRRGRFIKLDDYLGAFRCHAQSKSSTIFDVAQSEGIPLWTTLFPEFPEGWKNSARIEPSKRLFRFIRHPFLIALPFLYRRFFLGLRNMEN